MLNKRIEAALNEQIKHELGSAYVYLSMAAHCEANNYPGFAHWLQVQAKEELAHAMRFFGFVHDRGGKVVLQALPQPESEFASIVGVFEQVVEHEEDITARIHALYALAVQEQDYASQPFLLSFVTEQVEEEKSANTVLHMVKMAGNEHRALFLVDRELAHRA